MTACICFHSPEQHDSEVGCRMPCSCEWDGKKPCTLDELEAVIKWLKRQRTDAAAELDRVSHFRGKAEAKLELLQAERDEARRVAVTWWDKCRDAGTYSVPASPQPSAIIERYREAAK